MEVVKDKPESTLLPQLTDASCSENGFIQPDNNDEPDDTETSTVCETNNAETRTRELIERKPDISTLKPLPSDVTDDLMHSSTETSCISCVTNIVDETGEMGAYNEVDTNLKSSLNQSGTLRGRYEQLDNHFSNCELSVTTVMEAETVDKKPDILTLIPIATEGLADGSITHTPVTSRLISRSQMDEESSMAIHKFLCIEKREPVVILERLVFHGGFDSRYTYHVPQVEVTDVTPVKRIKSERNGSLERSPEASRQHFPLNAKRPASYSADSVYLDGTQNSKVVMKVSITSKQIKHPNNLNQCEVCGKIFRKKKKVPTATLR